MADELDPVLEARLRDVLRQEADNVPFTLRADTVSRVGNERRRARTTQRLTILSAAAVVVLAVAGAVLTLNLRNSATVAQTPAPSATPSMSTGPATPDAVGLQPLSVLEGEVAQNGAKLAITGEATVPGPSGVKQTLGVVPASRETIVAISCAGGTLDVQIWAGRTLVNSSLQDCALGLSFAGPQMLLIDGTLLGTGTGPGGEGTVVVVPMGSVRWRIAAGTRDAAPTPSPVESGQPPASASPAAGLPDDATLLAAAGQGAVTLQALSADARPADAVDALKPVSHRVALAVVVACTGGDISLVDLGTPQSSSPAGTSPGVTCDGTPQVFPWDGWNRVVTDGPSFALAVPSGTAYRAILADTSLTSVPEGGGSNAMADGLPTTAHLVPDIGHGRLAASGQLIGSASAADATTQAADIRISNSIQVSMACIGTTAALQVVGQSGAATGLGSPACDGTVQTYFWDRAGGPSDAASLQVVSTAGTTWRVGVRDLTYQQHARSTVACEAPSASLTTAPTATVRQGAATLGTMSYYASTWGATSDDGVATVPSTAIRATSDPMILAIAGNVCATRWTVVYGTPSASGIGIDPVGLLAVDGVVGAVTPSFDTWKENRITLAGLPSGDWVLQISLTFANGSGEGLLRVHVP